MPTTVKIINARLTNNPPVANAGEDQNVPTKAWVYPDGSASYDADGDLFSYAWRKVSEPEGSNVSFRDGNTATPKFMPSSEGEYTIGLIVNDTLDVSAEDFVVYTAIDGYSGFQEMSIEGLSLASYPNPATDVIHIQYTVPALQQIKLELVSITDKKKHELISITARPGQYLLTIDLNEYQLAKGLYLLQLISGQSAVYNKIAIY